MNTDLLTELVRQLDKRVVWCQIVDRCPLFQKGKRLIYLAVHECEPELWDEEDDGCCCVWIHQEFWEEMRERYPRFTALATECGAVVTLTTCPEFPSEYHLLIWLTKLTGLPFVLCL